MQLPADCQASPLLRRLIAMTEQNTGPLAGIRVVDLSRLVAGNMLSVVLADFGADVIKVERPGVGDDLRAWREADTEIYWKAYARNKRSITADLKTAAGRTRVQTLARQSHVLIENFLPGKMEEMGLGPEPLMNANPKLIYVRVTGWGQTGSHRHKPGFGTLVEAMSGYAHLNGFADRPPTLPPLATADMIAGLYGAFGVLAALRAVEVNGGRGQVVDLSLFESIFSFVAAEALKFRLTGKVSMRAGNQAVHTAPRNVYATQDGRFLALSGSMQSMYERLVKAIGRPELVDDPRFRTNDDRVRHRDDLDAIIGGWIGSRSLEDNLAVLTAAGITVAPALTVADLLDHQYVQSRAVLTEQPDTDMGSAPLTTPIPRLSATPGSFRRQAPELGEDEEAILTELRRSEGDR